MQLSKIKHALISHDKLTETHHMELSKIKHTLIPHDENGRHTQWNKDRIFTLIATKQV